MASLLTLIRLRMRYYRHCPGQAPLDGLRVVGIRIHPYCLYEESLSQMGARDWSEQFAEYHLGFLGPADMPALAGLPDRRRSEEQLLERLQRGHVCFGARLGDEVAAFTWWDTASCGFPGHVFALSADEAFFCDAYTAPAYRGIGLVEFVRYQAYQELLKQGRTRFYSVSEYFNTPAVRFKQKLNARVVDGGVYVECFGRWHWAYRRHGYRLQRRHGV